MINPNTQQAANGTVLTTRRLKFWSRSNSPKSEEQSQERKPQMKRSYITIAVLFFINLINYMDRLTIAGVLSSTSDYYNLSKTEAGLLQTAFVISYMIMAPLFGYLGDRYNRKNIIMFGVLFWSGTTLAGSFIPSNHFWAFILLRALVGTGEASYSTVAPTIIADLFTQGMRTKMVAVFYFAIPLGSGLGYIVGSAVAELFGDWKWALRVTPPLGVLAVIVTFLVVREPKRGESEGASTSVSKTSLKEDLKDLLKNRSFVWSTLGFTCVTFATGCLAWWAPTFNLLALQVQNLPADENSVGLKFGVITCVAGFVGITLGTIGSNLYRRRNPRADPLICGFGVISCVPLIFLGCSIAHKQNDIALTLIFFGEVFLCMNWAIVADMLLYIVIPTRRSMAGAVQILFSHMLGDAVSPYLIGIVSDAYLKDKLLTIENNYLGLLYALYITCFVLVFGGVCFLMTTFYIVEDRENCKKITSGEERDSLFSQQYLPNPVSDRSVEDLTWSFHDTQQLLI